MNDMSKEELVLKWLNNELSHDELKAFKQLDEYNSYIKLLTSLKVCTFLL